MSWLLDFVPWWVWAGLIALALMATFPWWSAIWLAAPRWLKALLGFAAAVLGAYAAGRYRGTANERQRQNDANAQAVKRRNDTNAEVTNLDPAARKREFDKWLRD